MPSMYDVFWAEYLKEFKEIEEKLEVSSHNVDVESSTKSNESLNIENL